MRSIFDWKKRSMNFSKRRATDLKGNARVYFPRKARSLEVESSLQTLRDILMTTFRLYRCVERKGGRGVTSVRARR